MERYDVEEIRSRILEPQLFRSVIEHLEQEPRQFGVLAVTLRSPFGWRTTINLPAVVGGIALSKGDLIELEYRNLEVLAAHVHGERIALPFQGDKQ